MNHSHDQLQARAEAEVHKVLKEWFFPDYASVVVKVLCADDTEAEEFYGAIQWGYLPNQVYIIKIRCDTEDQLPWLVRHELLEAMLAEYAEFVDTLDDGKQPIIHEWHQLIRDRFIERMLHILNPQFAPPIPARMT